MKRRNFFCLLSKMSEIVSEEPEIETNTVPDIVVGRLPLYLRALSEMALADKHFTSSQELADALGISSAQIRKDLSHFGEFGKQGTGYAVLGLRDHLRNILRLDREWPLIVVGAGHIGSAVANYTGFAERGFRVVAVFDNNLARVGDCAGTHTIYAMTDLKAIVEKYKVRHAMLTVPAEAAQAVAEQVIAVGIKAILNYAPTTLAVPIGVHVEYIDPVLHLQRMTYYL